MQCLCSLSLDFDKSASTSFFCILSIQIGREAWRRLQVFVGLLSIAHHCFSKLIVFWVWYLSTSGIFLCSSYTGVFMPEKYIIFQHLVLLGTHTHNRMPGSQSMYMFHVKGQSQSYDRSYISLFSHCNIQHFSWLLSVLFKTWPSHTPFLPGKKRLKKQKQKQESVPNFALTLPYLFATQASQCFLLVSFASFPIGIFITCTN